MTPAEIHAIAVSINEGEWFNDTKDMLEFAAKIRNAALEEAALKCERIGDASNTASICASTECAKQIWSMKS